MPAIMSSTRARWGHLGLALVTITTSVIAAAPPAFAANPSVALSPAAGVVGGGETATATFQGFLTGISAPATLFTTAPCAPTYTATGGLTANTTKISDGSATITAPAGVVPGTAYKVCFYSSKEPNGALAGNASWAVTPGGLNLNPMSGPTGGGNTISANLNNFLTASTTPAATFSPAANSCPAAYGTPAPNLASSVVTRSNASTATIIVPPGVVLPNMYSVCVYAGSTASAPLLGSSIGMYGVTPPTVTLSPASGFAGGGNPILLTAPSNVLDGVVNVAVAFSTAPCTGMFMPTGGALAANNVMKMSDNQLSVTAPPGLMAPNTYNVCIYAIGADNNSSLIGISGGQFAVTLPSITLSATTGKAGGGNTITATSNAEFLANVTTPGVLLTPAAAGCPTPSSTMPNMTAPGTRIGPNRLAFTVPSGVTGTNSYKVCIYDGTSAGSMLIAGGAIYTSTAALILSSVYPAAGPALGGSTITVTGSGFPTTPGSIINATLGGIRLERIKEVSATTFTALTPPHAPGLNLTLAVTTSSGTTLLRNAFNYTNGIMITPDGASNDTADVDVYVVGVGFLAWNFSGADSDAHVYLVNGVYNAAPSAGIAAYKTNGAVAECVGVLVISDTELICKLQLTERLGADGEPIGAGRTVTDGVTTLADTTFASATAHFTTADIGMTLTQTAGGGGNEIPANTSIVSVTSPTEVELSNAATNANGSNLTVKIGGTPRLVDAIATTFGSTTVTSAAGKFLSTDVGRPITGNGVSLNPPTIITAVTANGNGATLSRTASSTGTGPLAVSPAAQVPDGVYTMTVVSNGALNAAATDTEYTQSIGTRRSTFTVADY
jgi:hypothetical protein